MKDTKQNPTVYSPNNEPYLGRESVFHFDKVIVSCLESNSEIARYTHKNELTELQKAACQVIPQGINLALSIRELVRQGYLFAAAVLMRPLIERAAIISYLSEQPEKVSLWQSGWKYQERPSLGIMLASMNKEVDVETTKQVLSTFNSLTHGDPIGSEFNLVHLNNGSIGYSVGKALEEPEFCDFICFQSYLYLIVIMARMVGCFPELKKSSKGIG